MHPLSRLVYLLSREIEQRVTMLALRLGTIRADYGGNILSARVRRVRSD